MAKNDVPHGPALAGIRVLDMGRVLAAPIAAQTLGDFGADVVKVERRGLGDEGRHYGPSFLFDEKKERTEESSFYLSANRNKRSIAIDLSKEEGRQLAKALIAKADVLIENFLPGTMARFGLDYASVSTFNPGIVYCSLTGYGQTGPYSQRPGYDAVFQAQSGLMQVTGMPDEEPGGGPMRTGPSLVDVVTGYNAANAILAALLERERLSGLGQQIDIALLDTAIAMQSHLVQDYLLSGRQPPRAGTVGNGGHPARVFRCRDGDIYISSGNNKFYVKLCRVLDRLDLIDDPRFATGMLRFTNRLEWNRLAEPIIAEWSAPELLAALAEVGVPSAAVNSYEELFSDPHVVERGIKRTMDHPFGADGQISVISNPSRLSRTPTVYDRRPPLLGENTKSILTDWLDLDANAISALENAEAI